MRWPKYWSFSFSISPSKICQQIWKTQQWPQDWKRSVFIPISKKGNAKECSYYCTIVLISHTSKVRLKILQGSVQQYMNCKLPDVQAGFREVEKAEEPDSRQEYWSGLPFLSPEDYILSELSTMTCPSWVALHCMAYSFIELDHMLWSMWLDG